MRIKVSLRSRLRAIGAAVAAALTVAAGAVVASSPAHADPLEACTPTSGAVVAVDLGPWGGPVVRGCDATPTTGFDLLHEAGFSTTGTVHDGPGFICRIGHATFQDGAERPVAADEPCTLTPQATASWSYWIAPAGQDHWTYSPLGAMAHRPGAGEVEAWVYGGTGVGGTTGAPTFTPASVRAAGPTPSPSPSGGGALGEPGAQPAPAQVGAAAAYLAGKLTGGDHVDYVYDEGVDYPRTIAVATALAATGGQDPALTKILAYLAAHVDLAVFPPDGEAALAQQGNAAALALLVTITGGDPRAFGGRDLLRVLTDRVCTAADVAAGCTAAGDFAGSYSPITHATALLALNRAGVTPAASTVSRLIGLQCAGGGFADSLINPGEQCNQDPANTGLAVQALSALGGHDTELGKAEAYLTGAQQTGGGLLPYAGAGGPETFPTAFAAEAFTVLAASTPAAAARGFLTARIAADGGLAPDATAAESDLAVTSLAVPALAGKTLATLTHQLGGEPPQGPAPDLVKGAAYLVAPSQLIDGRYYESFPGFPDFGLSIDGAFALAAAGGQDAKLRAITEFIRGGGKVGDSGFDVDAWLGVGTQFPSGGAIGKVAVLAQSTGYDPRAFGGHDLITALHDVTCAATDATLGCVGAGSYRNAASVFAQSLGIIAQLRAGQRQDAAAPAAYLLSLQRADGSFPSLIPPLSAEDRDVDSTAIAAMALALRTGDAAAASAVDKALAWIAGQQQAHGGFPGAAGDSTNSTALAIQGLALHRATYTAQIAKARELLAGQQNSDGGFNVAVGGQPGSDLRASTQVVGGAAGVSFGVLLRDVHADPGTGSPSASASPSTSASASPSASSTDPGTPGGLPVTGQSILTLIELAFGLVIAGVALLAVARRRTATRPADTSTAEPS